MHIGMGMQVVALSMLTVPDAWLSVAYVMLAQALSGIAKDLNKMSAKASVKSLSVGPGDETNSRLFKYVAVLTGSKNALKGAGFFIGAALLQWIGFRGALWVLAGTLLAVLVATAILLPSGVGKMKSNPKFTQIFSNTGAINWLSAARFFLFGARDVWFVVGLPVFDAFASLLTFDLLGLEPEGWVTEHLGGDAWYTVPGAVPLGIPLYSNATGVIPVAEAMLTKGVAVGTTLTLMMSVAALSLPEMLILRKVVRWQVLALFVSVLAIAFTLVGWCSILLFKRTIFTDITEIMSFGVMSAPGVVVDGEVVHAGGIPGPDVVRAWVREQGSPRDGCAPRNA